VTRDAPFVKLTPGFFEPGSVICAEAVDIAFNYLGLKWESLGFEGLLEDVFHVGALRATALRNTTPLPPNMRLPNFIG
jgi:hypothetical protein